MLLLPFCDATLAATVTSKINPSMKEVPSLNPEEVCLMRATLGKKKISAHILFKDQAKFSQQMNNILKVHIDNLKEAAKKDKKKDKKKASAAAAASSPVASVASPKSKK